MFQGPGAARALRPLERVHDSLQRRPWGGAQGARRGGAEQVEGGEEGQRALGQEALADPRGRAREALERHVGRRVLRVPDRRPAARAEDLDVHLGAEWRRS